MNEGTSLLSWITFTPLIGVAVILFLKQDFAVRVVATVATLFTLLLCWPLYTGFDVGTSSIQFVQDVSWIRTQAWDIRYTIGVDGLSMPLILLTALLSFLTCIYSFSIKERVKEFFLFFLLLEVGMMGVFVALDFFLFYVFWEITLLPMYFIIGIWGGPRKKYAAIKFFLYTLFGSVFMLLSIIALYFYSDPHTFNMIELAKQGSAGVFTRGFQLLVYPALFVGFAIKVPVFPFHTWLPDAHVEAPTPGSVILAGVLLKMGIYGMLRISFPMLPEAATWTPYVWGLAILGLINIIYGAFVAMAQTDLKKLIAYSSISHMGYCLIGMAAMTATGFNGAVMQMFSHGIITGALFMLVGVLYDRAHTRDIAAFGGIWVKMPIYGGIMGFSIMASLGLPGLAGFPAEFMAFLGTFETYPIVAILAVIGIVLTAALLLRTFQTMFLGPLNEKWSSLTDMDLREKVSVIPLLVLMFVVGIFPSLVTDLMDVSMTALANTMQLFR